MRGRSFGKVNVLASDEGDNDPSQLDEGYGSPSALIQISADSNNNLNGHPSNYCSFGGSSVNSSKRAIAQNVPKHFVACIFVLLVTQNAAAALLITTVNHAATNFNSQCGVIIQEVIKLITCFVWVLTESGLDGLRQTVRPSVEMLKTSVPALLYLAQNNLQYIAARYLDASTFAVMFQLKILTTAVLSVLILGKKLESMQWIGLIALAGGSALVVYKPSSAPLQDVSTSSQIPGVLAVLVATVTSGLAGVYFEKLLKHSTQSIASRNMVLAAYSVLIGAGSLQASSSNFDRDFFSGFTSTVWGLVFVNGWGGLLVAVIIKYADNLVKCFATTLSLIMTMAISFLFLGMPVGFNVVLGTFLVIIAIFAYNSNVATGQVTDLLARCSWKRRSDTNLNKDRNALTLGKVVGV